MAAVLRAAVVRDGCRWLDVHGASMGRAIADGSRVLVRPGERPRRGEVWAFTDDFARVLVHRYRSERHGLLWFQGDANAVVDQGVRRDRLIGRVATVDGGHGMRRLGHLRTLCARLGLDVRSGLRRIGRYFRILRHFLSNR